MHVQFMALVFLFVRDTNQCNNNLCFNWRYSLDKLTLICRAANLNHRIYIMDPYGQSQADCLPLVPIARCNKRHENETISLNHMTNETVFALTGSIDYRLNGNWTCRHGKRKDVAKVEVTIRQYLQIDTQFPTNNSTCKSCKTVTGTSCVTEIVLMLLLVLLILAIISWMVYKARCRRTHDSHERDQNAPPTPDRVNADVSNRHSQHSEHEVSEDIHELPNIPKIPLEKRVDPENGQSAVNQPLLSDDQRTIEGPS